MRQSEVAKTKSGINALEQAFTGVTRIRQDVESTRFNLASGYKGSDGKAFGDLIDRWEGKADIILRNLRDMIEKLNQTLIAHNQQQGSSNEHINQAYSQSESVFEALHG